MLGAKTMGMRFGELGDLRLAGLVKTRGADDGSDANSAHTARWANVPRVV